MVEGGQQEAGACGARAADALGDARELQLGDGAIVVLHVHHQRPVRRAPDRRRRFRHLLCDNNAASSTLNFKTFLLGLLGPIVGQDLIIFNEMKTKKIYYLIGTMALLSARRYKSFKSFEKI